MKEKSKIIHIAIIILGILVISIPVFHTNLWFDESYSVALANHSFQEIWTIDGNDVHPVLYYWVLHIINIIFGSNIIIYRLFSVLCVAILGIIGYTHIRKDFGEKTGLIFSFLAFFFPVNMVYAGEIRMYSMAMLLVTLMSIYGYRIYINKEDKNIKNWILFAIFSLSSAYTHYYGLMIAGLENLFLFIYFILQAKKEGKFVYNLKAFIISAIIQIILYLPWLISLFVQMNTVSNGFWINITFPDTLIDFFSFQFTGSLEGATYLGCAMDVIFGLIICIYIIFLAIKNRKDKDLEPAKLAIKLWLLIVLSACVVSLIIWMPIIYARYMLCVMGLFMFYIAHLMGKKGNNIINICICIISLIFSICICYCLTKENYHISNKNLDNYIKENIQEQDLLICSDDGLSAFVVFSKNVNNRCYFLNKDNWSVDEAYKAYGETVYDLDFLEDYNGRIWVMNGDNGIVDNIKSKYDVESIQKDSFSVEYKKYQYTFELLEKE